MINNNLINKSSYSRESGGDITSKNNKPNNLFLLIFSIYISFNINGIFGSIPYLRGEFNLALSFLVIGYVALITQNFFYKFFVTNKAYLIVITLILIGIYDLLLNNDNDLLFSFLSVIVYYTAFTYLMDKLPSKGLLLWLMINILYKIILTAYWLRIDQLIIKKYDHIGFATANGITRSIIGYGAIYMITPCIILMIEYYRGNGSKYKLITLCTIISSILIVCFSQVSMMIFALSAMLIFYYFTKIINSTNGKRIFFIFVFSLVLIYLFRIPILTYLSNVDFLGSTVKNRIESLLDVFSHDMDYVYSQYSGSMVKGDSVINRFYSYSESFKAFFHNFFLGYLTPNAIKGAGHSAIIDMVSQYGIITLLPLIMLLYKGYKKIRLNYQNHILAIGIIYIYIVLISCLNNLALSTIFLITYIILPQILASISPEKDVSHENIMDH